MKTAPAPLTGDLAGMYERGVGTPVDDGLAAKLYTLACAHHSATACAAVQRRAVKEAGIRRTCLAQPQQCATACDGSQPIACRELGRTLEDPTQAASLFEKGCQLGDTAACYSLAKLLREGRGVERNISRARELDSKACAEDETGACDDLIQMLNAQEIIPKRSTLFGALHGLCRNGRTSACDQLKAMGIPKDSAQATPEDLLSRRSD